MDVAVTVPKHLWWEWVAEGMLPDEPWDPEEDLYHFFGRGEVPTIVPGERVYIVAHGRLRGYAPLVRLERPECPLQPWWWAGAQWALARAGGAVAVTIPRPIRGFRGYQYRSWEYSEEIPFPAWETANVPDAGYAPDGWKTISKG